MTHELKTWPEYFQAIIEGYKTFEARKNDRNFQEGDTLILKEFIPTRYSSVSPNEITGNYTGKELKVTVIYILNNYVGLLNGYCILAIKILD